MTLRLPTFTAVLLAAVAAFGATFLVLRTHDGALSVPSGASAATGSVALPSATTDQRIAVYQQLVRANPKDVDASVLLAAAYAQKVRETGDAALYLKADALLRGALARKADDVGAL